MKKPAAPRRIRRSAEDARAQIIAAAKARIAEGGPGALRLQDVAADVGVSHPTLLHHFGSRGGLLREVQAHSVGMMRDALLTRLASSDGNAGLVPAVFEVFRGGLAQQLAWLSQSKEFRPTDVLPFEEVVDALYAQRVRDAENGSHHRRQDTANIAHLVVIAAFGDALLGSLFRNENSDVAEERERMHFQDWLRFILREHLAAQASGK